MNTISQDSLRGRTRRTYSASFRAELVEQCRQVGVSCSAVAIAHGMNPNVLRRWIKEARSAGGAVPAVLTPMSVDVQSAFMPLPLTTVAARAPSVAAADVRIEIQRNGATISVMWPACRLEDSVAWVREILR